MSRIVVAGESADRRRGICRALLNPQYTVRETGMDEAISNAEPRACDLLAADFDGAENDIYDFCRRVRSHSTAGIIVIVRDSGDQSRIDALNAGADDYIADPDLPVELPARVRAILRRVSPGRSGRNLIRLPDRIVDLDAHKISRPDGLTTHLTPIESRVLQYLTGRPNELVANRELAQAVWDRTDYGDFEYVRTVIGQIRRKIERDTRRPEFLVTERMTGYRFTWTAEQTGIQATVRSEYSVAARDRVPASCAAD